MSNLAKPSLPNHKKGGAALEYILVSTFAAVVTIAALGFVGTVVKKQLANMASRLGIDEGSDDLWDNPFGDP